MDKSVFILSNVAANTTVQNDSAPLASGKKIFINAVGACDINVGDNKSSVYLIQFGSNGSFEEIFVISVTGNTVHLPIKKQLVGDGVKFVRITRQNNSASNKRCPVWIFAYDE